MKNFRMLLAIASVLVMAAIWAFIGSGQGTGQFDGLELFVLALTIVIGIVAIAMAIKKFREEKDGFVLEDEMSRIIKYKAGYQAYMASMYMWLFIFLLKDKFPNVESMLGGGILLSAAIAMITRYVVKMKFDAESN